MRVHTTVIAGHQLWRLWVSVHTIHTADQGMRAHITLTADQDILEDLSEGSHYRYSMSSTLGSSMKQATAD